MTENNKWELSSDIKLVYKILREDLNEMSSKLTNAAFPILALVCSGIDFSGGLIEGFGSSSRTRFVNFLVKYMYPRKSKLAHFIYTFIRNKIAHSAFIYGKFETKKDETQRHWHLKHKIVYDSEGIHETLNTIYIDPDKFKDDFLLALDKFEEEFNDGFIYSDNILLNFKKEKDKMKEKSEKMIEECELDKIEIDNVAYHCQAGTSQQTYYILKERKGINFRPRYLDKNE